MGRLLAQAVVLFVFQGDGEAFCDIEVFAGLRPKAPNVLVLPVQVMLPVGAESQSPEVLLQHRRTVARVQIHQVVVSVAWLPIGPVRLVVTAHGIATVVANLYDLHGLVGELDEPGHGAGGGPLDMHHRDVGLVPVPAGANHLDGLEPLVADVPYVHVGHEIGADPVQDLFRAQGTPIGRVPRGHVEDLGCGVGGFSSRTGRIGSCTGRIGSRAGRIAPGAPAAPILLSRLAQGLRCRKLGPGGQEHPARVFGPAQLPFLAQNPSLRKGVRHPGIRAVLCRPGIQH